MNKISNDMEILNEIYESIKHEDQKDNEETFMVDFDQMLEKMRELEELTNNVEYYARRLNYKVRQERIKETEINKEINKYQKIMEIINE